MKIPLDNEIDLAETSAPVITLKHSLGAVPGGGAFTELNTVLDEGLLSPT